MVREASQHFTLCVLAFPVTCPCHHSGLPGDCGVSWLVCYVTDNVCVGETERFSAYCVVLLFETYILDEARITVCHACALAESRGAPLYEHIHVGARRI